MSASNRPFQCLFPILAFIFIAATIVGHEENEEAESTSQAEIEKNLGEERIARQDSLFTAINEKYLVIKPIFKTRCFDCHSQFTEYPWYYKLPVIKGIIDDDIKEGREHLDFSNDFPFPGRGNILDILNEMKEEISEGEMPLFSYRLIHWGKTIEGAQRDSVINWVDESLEKIIEFYKAENIPYQIREEDD